MKTSTQVITGVPAAATATTAPINAEVYVNVLAVNGIWGIAYAQWFQILAAMWVMFLLAKNTYSFFRWLYDSIGEE